MLFILVQINFYKYDLNMIFLIESNSINWILNLTLLLLDLFTGNFGNEIYVFELFHIASNDMDMLYLDYLTWYSDLHLFGLNQYLHSFLMLFILVKINFYQYDLNMIFLIKSNSLNWILNLTVLLDLFINKVFIIMGILLFLANCSIYRFLTPFGNFKMYYYSLSFYFPITKYMVIIILRRDEFYVFKLFPSISNRKVIPFLIQVGFAEYGYIYFISFYLICLMKYLKKKNFL